MAQVDKTSQDPNNLKEQLKAKIDAFAVEELEARLEMEAWFDDVNVACKSAVEVQA